MIILEIAIILVVLIFQLKFFAETGRNIQKLQNLFEFCKGLVIQTYYIPVSDYKNLESSEILENLIQYLNQTQSTSKKIQLINNQEESDHSYEIIQSINLYLVRIGGSAADFSIIKDVIERNSDVVEEEIQQTISVPLYLGLVGTMTGIIFGFLGMWMDGTANINTLIMSVTFAMFASACGLILTVYSSAIQYKKAKTISEFLKNSFYTKIQTELLTSVDVTLSSVIDRLQNNIDKFNTDFSANLSKLSQFFKYTNDNLIEQREILQKMQEIDITKIAKYNIDVVQEINKTVDAMKSLSVYVSSFADILNKSEVLTYRLDHILSHTNKMEEMFTAIQDLMKTGNEQLQDSLKVQQNLDALMNAITKPETGLSAIIKNLSQENQKSFQDSIKVFKDEQVKFQKLLKDENPDFGKLKLLEDVVKKLEGIEKGITELSKHQQNVAKNQKQQPVPEKKEQKQITQNVEQKTEKPQYKQLKQPPASSGVMAFLEHLLG